MSPRVSRVLMRIYATYIRDECRVTPMAVIIPSFMNFIHFAPYATRLCGPKKTSCALSDVLNFLHNAGSCCQMCFGASPVVWVLLMDC